MRSLTKVLACLGAFTTARRSMSLAEIAAVTGFPRSTAHRPVASMREVGLLDQRSQRDRYRLGIKLFQLGNTALANMDLHREARRDGRMRLHTSPIVLRDRVQALYRFHGIGRRPMPAFNAVRFRVKPGRDQQFLDAHKNILATWPGWMHANIIKTGERSYCLIAEWKDVTRASMRGQT